MNRYFIVFYIATNVDTGATVTGQTDFIVDNAFINLNETLRAIKETNKQQGLNIKHPVLTNVIEISETDYVDWI